jgi:hypothetical protein
MNFVQKHFGTHAAVKNGTKDGLIIPLTAFGTEQDGGKIFDIGRTPLVCTVVISPHEGTPKVRRYESIGLRGAAGNNGSFLFYSKHFGECDLFLQLLSQSMRAEIAELSGRKDFSGIIRLAVSGVFRPNIGDVGTLVFPSSEKELAAQAFMREFMRANELQI